jgi:hypothetical protein
MMFMKISLLFTVWLLSLPVNGQIPFGEKCLGTWEGNMKIYSRGVLKDSVDVRLTVTHTKTANAWTWKTEYLSPIQPMTKDYILRLPEPEKNKYITDEGDGVELTGYLFGNKLYDMFETHGVFLTSSYELVGNELIFEVTSGKKEPVTHPEINNYSVDNLQRVVFRRKK